MVTNDISAGTSSPAVGNGKDTSVTEGWGRWPPLEQCAVFGRTGQDPLATCPFSLLAIQREMDGRDTFVLQPRPMPDLCTIALASSNAAMFLVLDTLTGYLGLDLSLELGGLKANAQVDPMTARGRKTA